MASIIDLGGRLTGTTHETSPWSDPAGATLFAAIEGACVAGQVSFTKTYDGSGGWTHAVYYVGALADGHQEIGGDWSIPGDVRGRFLMIRRSGGGEAIKNKALVETDA